MKIRALLLGAVGASALVGGLLAGAGPASAAPAVRACLGAGCDGMYPVPSGCSIGAITLLEASGFDFSGSTRVTVELRYSPYCRSVWAKIYGTPSPNGALFWVHNEDTGQTQFANFETQYQNSRMDGDLNTMSQACVNVLIRDPDRQMAVCTGFE